MICKNCGHDEKQFSEATTLVGYYAEPGHEHDDNCLKRYYNCSVCKSNWIESKIRTCNDTKNKKPACDWKGKETCFCHSEPKVAEWTDD